VSTAGGVGAGPGAGAERERGAALVLAVLVTAILSLLGIASLLMARSEVGIAENGRRSALALYAAESGARLAVAWLNAPVEGGFLVPGRAEVDLTRRLLDHDSDPATARVRAIPADPARPLYKDPALTTSGLFDRPYDSGLADAFSGVETGFDGRFAEDGPDLKVKAHHLAAISEALFPAFPGPDLRARIAAIEIYGPPVSAAGDRLGIATIRVTGALVVHPGTADEREVAARVVRAVIREIPIPRPLGPLQSCAALHAGDSFEVRWGIASTVGDADLPADLDGALRSGLPYARDDPFSFISGAHSLASWAAAHDGGAIEDPWFRLIAGGAIDGAPNGDRQPWPHVFPGSMTSDHSNLFQHGAAACPVFAYDTWKAIARSGGRHHYYFASAGSSTFRLDGAGEAMSFAAASSGRQGILFFDTLDGLPPRGSPDDPWPAGNLTDGISIDVSDGWLGTQGIVYLNARSLLVGGTGAVRTIFPPGEPRDGSGFVNLAYPGSLDGGYAIRDGAVSFASFFDPFTGRWHCTDAAQCDATARAPASSPVHDPGGLPFSAEIANDGILYLGGTLEARGGAAWFGAVVAGGGVIDAGGDPGFYFDAGLETGDWPRPGTGIPRVVVTSWQTDRP
jgi:hypothetical protein